MSLHSELTTAGPIKCTLCAYLSLLLPEEVAEWNKELALPVAIVGNTAVVKALMKRSVDITEVSVRRHRSRHVTR